MTISRLLFLPAIVFCMHVSVHACPASNPDCLTREFEDQRVTQSATNEVDPARQRVDSVQLACISSEADCSMLACTGGVDCRHFACPVGDPDCLRFACDHPGCDRSDLLACSRPSCNRSRVIRGDSQHFMPTAKIQATCSSGEAGCLTLARPADDPDCLSWACDKRAGDCSSLACSSSGKDCLELAWNRVDCLELACKAGVDCLKIACDPNDPDCLVLVCGTPDCDIA